MDRHTPLSGRLSTVRTPRDSDSMSRKSFSTASVSDSQYSYELYRGCTFNPNSQLGRRFFVVQLVILNFIPVMALIVQNGYTLGSAVHRQHQMLFLTRTITETTDVGLLLLAVQTERSEVTFHVFGGNISSMPQTAEKTTATEDGSSTYDGGHSDRLKRAFEDTDLALERLMDWRGIASHTNQQWQNRMFASKIRFQTYLGDLRRMVLARQDQSLARLRWYDRATDLLLRQLVQHISGQKLSSVDISKQFMAYINTMRAIEHLGLLLSVGLRYLSAGTATPRQLARAVRSDTLFWEYIGSTRGCTADISGNKTGILNGGEGMATFMTVRDGNINNTPGSSLGVSTTAYFKESSAMLDQLRAVQLQLKNNIEAATGEEASASLREQIWTASLLVLVLILSLVGILMTRKAATEMESFTESLSAKTAQVRRERRRSDKLLCQMLPASVAFQLKSMHMATAESFQAITVLFSDIVDFPSIAADSTPIQVMALVNRLFKIFDKRIDRFDVYKVESVETVYMCASGLPHKNGDRHVTEVADLALEMLATAYRFEIPHLPNRPLEIRLGINSGPCVAGVVGTKMPRYCLFGDTINTASRMEHTGLAMKIHLTQRTCELLKQKGGYEIEFRGHISVQGKGTMETYWLVSKLDDIPSRNVGISISDE